MRKIIKIFKVITKIYSTDWRFPWAFILMLKNMFHFIHFQLDRYYFGLLDGMPVKESENEANSFQFKLKFSVLQYLFL